MEFHLNYFRSWKLILLKCCTQYVSVWKTQQCPQDWKNSVSIPVLKKGDVKECSSYHMIVFISHASKVMLKILQAMLQQYVSWEFPDVQAAFRKCRGIGDQIAKFIGSQRNHRNSRKISILASLTILKSLCGSQQTVDNSLKEENILPLYLCPEKPVCRSKSKLKANMEQQTGSKLRKEYDKSEYCHPACWIYMQSTSCEMLSWMNHKLESRLLGEISATSDMQMIPL